MKNCPYCAEEIQDTAIVCRFCGRDIPKIDEVTPATIIPEISTPAEPKLKKSKTKKVILFAIGGVMALCVLCFILATIINATPTVKMAQERTVAAMVASTLAQTGTAASTAMSAPTATKAPTSTSAPTPTPRPALGMDLSQFVAKYDSMTDIQKKDFVGQSIGKWVDWTGEINDVGSSGLIFIDIPGTLDMIDLSGVSRENAVSLSKGETIHFTGRLTSVIDFLGLNISIQDVQIIP